MKRGRAAGLVVGCLFAVVVSAQSRSPDQQATDYRQALMTVIQGNLAPLALMARDRAPYDAATVQKNAERVAALGGMMVDAFARDTSAAKVQGNEASPGIWKEKAEFDRLAGDVKVKADAVLAALKGGDQAAVKTALTALGSICGTCHDKYRVEQ